MPTRRRIPTARGRLPAQRRAAARFPHTPAFEPCPAPASRLPPYSPLARMLPWGVPRRKAERKQNAWKSLNAWKSPNSWAGVHRSVADLQFVAGFANGAETMKRKLQRPHPTRKIPLTGAIRRRRGGRGSGSWGRRTTRKETASRRSPAIKAYLRTSMPTPIVPKKSLAARTM